MTYETEYVIVVARGLGAEDAAREIAVSEPIPGWSVAL